MRYETWTGWGRFAVIGLLAVVMAACGGNGGNTPMTGGDDGDAVDVPALNAAKDAAMAAYDMAKKAVADVEAHKDADMDSYTTAVAKRDEAEAANKKAQADETVADAEKYRDMARDANTEAMKYADMVTRAAGTAADRAMAAAIAPAIADPDGDGVIVGVGQTDLQKDMRQGHNSDNLANSTTFTVAAGGAVTVDHDGGATTNEGQEDVLDKDDMPGDPPMSIKNQFMKQADAMRADLDGFAVSVHERTLDKVTDTLTVYTNVEDNADQAYQMYYGTNDAGARNGINAIAEQTIGEEGDDQYMANVITFDADVSPISDQIVATRFRIGNGVTSDTQFDDNDATTEVDEGEVEGSFNGIPGTYACETGCDVTTDDMGRVSTFAGTWIFTPTEAGSKMMVRSVIPDADFLTFGYWLQATEQADGSMTYRINTFHAGAQPFSTPIVNVEGTAEYSGKATGLYARKTFNNKGVGTPISSGQFTADANLMANFGGNNVAVNLQNSITGTVSNFMDDSGNMIDDDWSVKLNKANIAAAGGGLTIGELEGENDRKATTTGGGSWIGTFYGIPVDAMRTPITDNDATTAAPENAPTSVAGEFNAHFSNGHVIGAFGATKK